MSALIIHDVPIECINRAALMYQVPARLILAVLAIEGGRRGSAIQNKNGSVDYGPMQINSCWLPMLQTYGYTQQQIQYDPCINVQVGTWILSKNIAQAATLWRGVGNYNSKKPNLNRRYQNKVAEVDRLLQSYLSSSPTAS
ncbi:lytic transglycosylase domain-containing protein [Rickettsiella massiliensis]|uniref:lytic transglycosylase domain-containing protein n=1 Tax=Rickettsiella massiliensis TaxID=676517 RepID=UPI00029AB0D8|nr:lytic transglycosylase domain-containing protein [Rickettsiella massiliensis]